MRALAGSARSLTHLRCARSRAHRPPSPRPPAADSRSRSSDRSKRATRASSTRYPQASGARRMSVDEVGDKPLPRRRSPVTVELSRPPPSWEPVIDRLPPQSLEAEQSVLGAHPDRSRRRHRGRRVPAPGGLLPAGERQHLRGDARALRAPRARRHRDGRGVARAARGARTDRRPLLPLEPLERDADRRPCRRSTRGSSSARRSCAT